jgi:site-specific recombinase XerD
MVRREVGNLKDAIDLFLKTSETELKSWKTVYGYEDALKLFLKFCDNIPLEDLNEDHIRSFILHEVGRRRIVNGEEVPYSTETIYKRYKVVKTFIRWLFDRKYIDEDISMYVRNPKRDVTLPEVLTEEQVRKVFRILKGREFRDLVIYETFLYTGIRLSELAALKLDDLNFETGRMKIFGKGHRFETVPMGPALMRDLKVYILRHRKPAIPSEQAVFLNKNGFKLEARGVQMMIKRILWQAGITKKVGPHILRHTFATHYLRNGGSIEALRKIMRHSTINVTVKYTHLMDEDVESDYAKTRIETLGKK